MEDTTTPVKGNKQASIEDKSLNKLKGLITVKFVIKACEDNPKRYCSDNGELHLINDFFLINAIGVSLSTTNKIQLTIEQHKSIASIIRLRNKFLEDNPSFDYRVSNKQKGKSEHPNQGDLFRIYDEIMNVLTVTQRAVVDYLNTYSKWDEKPFIVAKSIRGASSDDVKCVMQYQSLFRDDNLRVKSNESK